MTNDREVPFQVDKAFGYSGPKLIGVEYDSATNMSLPLLVTLKPPFSNIRLFQHEVGNQVLHRRISLGVPIKLFSCSVTARNPLI